MRKWFWKHIESDLPAQSDCEGVADALIVQSDRLRQRTGRVCLWVAAFVGIAWAVVLTPHCWHLMKHAEWADVKAAWLVVSAPPVALIAALLGMAERFFTPAHLLHIGKKTSDDAANDIGKAMGMGVDLTQKGIEKLVDSAVK
jgi:hypothetical protein